MYDLIIKNGKLLMASIPARITRKRVVVILTESSLRFIVWRSYGIKEGYDVSITIFDHERLHAQATCEHPYRNNLGIEYVIANGQIALEHGIVTDVGAGNVLKRS